MEISKVIKIIRILTWIAFIVLALLSVYYKYDSCNVCKLEVEGQTLDGAEFMQYYQSKCLVTKDNPLYLQNLSKINFSEVK
jgi:hypothetical protein